MVSAVWGGRIGKFFEGLEGLIRSFLFAADVLERRPSHTVVPWMWRCHGGWLASPPGGPFDGLTEFGVWGGRKTSGKGVKPMAVALWPSRA